jgi:hypothetical protein
LTRETRAPAGRQLGLGGGEAKPLRTIAQEWRMSPEGVRQSSQRSMNRLRAMPQVSRAEREREETFAGATRSVTPRNASAAPLPGRSLKMGCIAGAVPPLALALLALVGIAIAVLSLTSEDEICFAGIGLIWIFVDVWVFAAGFGLLILLLCVLIGIVLDLWPRTTLPTEIR